MSRAMSRHCPTCAHYECCDGLPDCGGRYWSPAVDEDDEEEREEEAPEDGPDPHDQWEHDAEVWQESMNRKY